MEILHEDDGKNGLFFIQKDGVILAEMVYSWSGSDRITIQHTEVSEALKGLGAGKELVAAGVRFARHKGIRIIPLCSFAQSIFEKTTDFRDVL